MAEEIDQKRSTLAAHNVDPFRVIKMFNTNDA